MPSDLPSLIGNLVKEAIDHPELYNGRHLHTLIMEGVERVLIEKTLEHTGGNKRKAAQILGINRNTLTTKIKKYQLQEER